MRVPRPRGRGRRGHRPGSSGVTAPATRVGYPSVTLRLGAASGIPGPVKPTGNNRTFSEVTGEGEPVVRAVRRHPGRHAGIPLVPSRRTAPVEGVYLGAVALLVGGIGVANTMVISVLERRAEI